MNTQDQTNQPEQTTGDDETTALWNEMDQADAAATAPKTDTDGTAKTDADEASGNKGEPQGGKSDDDKGEPAPDIWANATPEQKAAFEALNTRLTGLEHENRSNRGRQSALQRAYPELFDKSGNVKPRPADWKPPVKAGAKDGGKPSPIETEEFKQFETEYPELAKPLKATVAALEEKVSAATTKLAEMDEADRNAALAENETVVAEAHPDWLEIAGSDEFKAWKAKQPGHRQAIIDANADAIVDPSAAIEAIKWFKDDKAATQNPTPKDGDGKNGTRPSGSPQTRQNGTTADPKRDLQLAGAFAPKTPGPRSVSVSAPGSSDPEQIWKEFDQIDAAKERVA